jgi:hypothetical protein
MVDDHGGTWKEGAGLGSVIADSNHQVKGYVLGVGQQF